MRVDRCDVCGKENIDVRRFAGDARTAAWEANADWLAIHLEHNDDIEHGDFCSWACLADHAVKKAAERVTP